MNFYSASKCLKIMWATLLACFLCFWGVCIAPFTDPWAEQCARATTLGDRNATGADEADFSQSEMFGPDHKIREGDTIDYEIILRNTGRKRPDYVELRNRIDSPSALLASAPELAYNLENRELHWRGTVDPGEERRFKVRLVTIPKSAGAWVSNHASIAWGTWVSNPASFWDIKGKSIQCDPLEVLSRQQNAGILFTIGRIGLGWVEVVILAYLVFVPFFLIVIPRLIRWRERQRFESSPDVSWRDDKFHPFMVYTMSIAFVACLAVMLFFTSIVFEDIRKFTSYEKTTCILLDKKIRWRTGSTGRTKSDICDPLVSVRYGTKGKEIVSAGSLAKGAFLSSRERSAEKRLARYELGRSYPCWFDPEDPHEFLLTRGLSWGWYLLCLGPLILFLISFCYLFRRLRRPEAPGQLFNAPIQ